MSWVRVLLSPHLLLLHLLAVLAVGVAGWLGWWQVSAWQEQRVDRSLQLVDDEPLPLAELLGPDDAFPGEHVGRPVEVQGTWLAGSTVYVEGRRQGPEGAADGFWQVAMLSTCGEAWPGTPCDRAPALPVVLGWTPSPEAGTAAPAGPVDVTGWLQPAEQGSPDPDPSDEVVPSLRIVDLLELTDRDLYSGYVILDEPATARGGLVLVTPETLPDPPPSTALRNLLYGLEWWVFAGFAVFLWWRWSRDAIHAARQDEPDRALVSKA